MRYTSTLPLTGGVCAGRVVTHAIPCLVLILRSSVCSFLSHIIPLVFFLFLQSHCKKVTYSQITGDFPTIYHCLPVTHSYKTAQKPWLSWAMTSGSTVPGVHRLASSIATTITRISTQTPTGARTQTASTAHARRVTHQHLSLTSTTMSIKVRTPT